LPLAQKHNHLSDDELLQIYRRTGDNAWLGHLLQRYTVLLIGVAMKYLKDKEAAHDAVQQIFLKSLTHLPAGEIGNFKGWLYVLMRNHCLQKLRDHKYFAPDEVLATIPAEADALEALRQHELSLADMQEALKELSADQHTCIQAFYLARKSYHQIMEETGFSFAQVKSHIQNGKRNLKIILTRRNRAKDES
jgi:RNA polymerase sigma-70 factor (ECF subfamily)